MELKINGNNGYGKINEILQYLETESSVQESIVQDGMCSPFSICLFPVALRFKC